NHPTARQRGFSLIEAAIAMAIMAFGMLAIIGLQGMLHQKADLGRQRSEATRLAEQQLEQLRSFNAISSGTGLVAWADMASGSDTPTGSNASFT
ncbi:prepilin-type N-terminal cleavage/methylation domain-containing protein, partial [Escherichia coli]